MKNGYLKALTVGLFLAIPTLAFAQTAPATLQPSAISVILSYHENNSGTFRVMSGKTAEVTGIQDGEELKPGWTVVTGS